MSDGYSPDHDRPLAGFVAIMGTFGALAAGTTAVGRARGAQLPDRVAAKDVALLAAASHKLARIITKDEVTSPFRAPFVRYEGPAGHGEVEERPRGRGLRKAVGSLLICPNCMGMWTTSAFVAGLVLAPRTTRLAATVFATYAAADALQLGYVALKDAT